MEDENSFYKYTQELIPKLKIFIPILKTSNKLLNSSDSATDQIIMERILYIRDLFCKKRLKEVLQNDNEQIELAQNIIDKLKQSDKPFNSNVDYIKGLKYINLISDELHHALKLLISPSDKNLHDISVEFCSYMIPIICLYDTRLTKNI